MLFVSGDFDSKSNKAKRIETYECDLFSGEWFNSEHIKLVFYSDSQGNKNSLKEVSFFDKDHQRIGTKISYSRSGILNNIKHY